MRDADMVGDLVARLHRLRRHLGSPLYRRAVTAARVAVARTVLREAEISHARRRGDTTRFAEGPPG